MMRVTVIAALAMATALVAPRALAADAPAESATTAAVRSASADRAVDRLQLDSTAITGNRELPKVMSIVPWKAAEPPAGPDRPMGSLIEEMLSPLDRDEFRREITYFSDLSSQSADRTSPGVPQP